MNQRNLLLLIAALAIVALAAFLSKPSNQGSLGAGDLLFPSLAKDLNAVTQLVVRRGGGEQVATLVRQEDSWVISDKDSYPANIARLRKNLRGLAEARIFESKTSNPEFYGRLGVEDISSAMATGTEFTLTGPAISAQIIVGRTDEGGGKLAYVRRAGESQSYLVTASLDPGQTTNDWLDAGIVDLPSARVRSVEIRHPDGEILGIAKARSESVNYTVADVPADRELSFNGVANAIGAALAKLNLEDVESAAQFNPGDMLPAVATFETFDGLRVLVSTWELPNGERRLAFSAAADTAQGTSAASEAGEDAAAASPVDAAELARIAGEAETINQRTNGWIYTLPSFKSDQFVQRMDNLLAAPE